MKLENTVDKKSKVQIGDKEYIFRQVSPIILSKLENYVKAKPLRDYRAQCEAAEMEVNKSMENIIWQNIGADDRSGFAILSESLGVFIGEGFQEYEEITDENGKKVLRNRVYTPEYYQHRLMRSTVAFEGEIFSKEYQDFQKMISKNTTDKINFYQRELAYLLDLICENSDGKDFFQNQSTSMFYEIIREIFFKSDDEDVFVDDDSKKKTL
jgi:hypothetical protein